MAKDTETVEAEEKADVEQSAPDGQGDTGGGATATDAAADADTAKGDAAKDSGDAAGDSEDASDSSVDWRELISDKDAKKAAERFNSLDDVFKSVSDLRKQISDRVKLPGKDSDEKEVAKFRKAMGIPDNPEGYELSLPDGVELSESDEALVEAIKPLAHEQNIPAEAFNGFVAKFKEFEEQALNEHQAAIEKQAEEAQDALRKEWGKDYEANLNIANRALKQLGGDELVEFVNKAELKSGGVIGNDPNMVRLFAKLGRRMSEDGAIEPVSKDEAADLQQQMEELTQKIHQAHNKGDRVTVNKLSAERSAIAEKLYGEQPIVGAGGRAV